LGNRTRVGSTRKGLVPRPPTHARCCVDSLRAAPVPAAPHVSKAQLAVCKAREPRPGLACGIDSEAKIAAINDEGSNREYERR
jgi:hypothetical protein